VPPTFNIEAVSIFIGYILDKTKTLYVMVAFEQDSQFFNLHVFGQTVFKSKSSYIQTSTVHKLLEDIHEESITKYMTNQPVPGQPSGQAVEVVWTPRSVLQINVEDVRTTEQHRLDARSISIQQGVVFQKLTLFGKSMQSVRTTQQHVRTMSSICRPSGRLGNNDIQ